MSGEVAPVRSGEQLDREALRRYLLGKIEGAAHAVEIEQFPSGHSNLTYLLRAGGREYVLRRPPLGPVAPRAHDMAREFEVLRLVHPLFPLAPEPLLLCEDVAVIGATFYLMERCRGVVLRRDVPPELAHTSGLGRRVSDGFIRTLAALHAIPASALAIGRPEGFLERQVRGWAGRWQRAETGDVPAIEAMDALFGWLIERMPRSGAPALVHNDYKLDNLMLDPADPGRVAAVLDWEMATVGDPLADLGCALCYWPEAADPAARRSVLSPVTAGPGWRSRAQLAEAYATLTGRDVSGIVYYEVFGLFKLAVILQQIYFRYRQGQTRDPRFGDFDQRVRGLVESAVRLAEAAR
ncbi:MAG: phosphotransferase family protein [Acidobacteria bacterium]|nr:phosphotransferase family protein [Acidobacteriota bacterium]